MKSKIFLSAAMALALAACGTTDSPKSPTHVVQTKPKAVVGLALGGGASKGFAHIGVIKVLRENNIPVNIVTGTSAGAVVGSLYASGMSPDRLELEAQILDQFGRFNPVHQRLHQRPKTARLHQCQSEKPPIATIAD